MKENIYFGILIFVLLIFQSCYNKGNPYARVEDSESIGTNSLIIEQELSLIRIPDDFNPTIPRTELNSLYLKELVIKKFYDFRNRENQRSLHDIHTGEELTPLRKLTLREEFENAAALECIDYLYERSLHPEEEITYNIVADTSYLAKVFFIQAFGLFVSENEQYCKNILDSIEKTERQLVRARNKSNQEKYK